MKVRLLSRANREFQEAADYLIEHSPPAARQFADVLEQSFQMLRDNPKMGKATGRQGTRVLILSTVPYKIFYKVEGDTIAIVSIFHSSRKPKDDNEI